MHTHNAFVKDQNIFLNNNDYMYIDKHVCSIQLFECILNFE